MQVIEKSSKLWEYLPEEIQGLILDGEQLLSLVESSHISGVSDYSYIVFPFAKAYEGFLKRLFLDLDMIKEDEYYGEDIRIGQVLNPFYRDERRSIYKKILEHKKGGRQLSEALWWVWRNGRNQVFHYFPHNYKKLEYKEACDLIEKFASAMSQAAEALL